MLIAAAVPGCTRESPPPAPRISALPEHIDPHCRDGKATLFDQCSDQIALFDAALARAQLERKVLLVEFGAEWCIWCHVFDAHVNGEHTQFNYVYGTPEEPDARYPAVFREGRDSDARIAAQLRDFVAANFVIVHIDCEYAPNGYEVLAHAAAAELSPKWIPYVFSVDSAGHFAKSFDHLAVEKRRDGASDWYRGYDRAGMLKQLTAMRAAALAAKR